MKYPTQTKGAALAVLALAGSASAIPLQGQGGYEVVPDGNKIAWPTAFLGTPGNFRRIVTGEFAGDSIVGALALVGDRAVYLYEPAVHKDVTSVKASGVNDIAALAPASPGVPAGMLLAATDALYVSTLNIVAGSIGTASIATGNFADLDLVRSGDINGAGLDDVVGANGANVYVLLESGSGWAAGSSFQASGTVRDMVVLDWNGTGQGDIAILLNQSVEIRQSNGTLIESRNGVAPGGYLTYIPPSPTYSTERLGWTVPLPSPSTNHALVVLSYPGVGVNCGIFDAVPASLHAAVFKDAPGGTRVDLLTSSPVNTEAKTYSEQASSPPYTAASSLMTYVLGPERDAGDGPPVFGDITLDGVPDTIAGRGATDDFRIVLGRPPTLGTEVGIEAWVEPRLVHDVDNKPWFSITVNLGDLQGYNHLQATLWWSGDDGGQSEFGEFLEPEALKNYAFGSLTANESVDVWMPLVEPLGEFVESEGQMGACQFSEGFALTVRLVSWAGTGNPVTAASSPLHGVFGLDPITMGNMIPPNSPLEIDWEELPCIQTPGVGYTPVASLPPKRNDLPPIVPAISYGPSAPQL